MTMDDLVLRPATLGDVDALVTLERASFATDRLTRRSFRHLLTQGHAATTVAVARDGMLGYVTTLFSRGTSMARIYSIAVASGARGRGLGRRLVERAEEAARDQGCREVRLEVREDNAASLALFRGLGYAPFGTLSDYYEDHADAIRLAKSLAPHLPLDLVRVPYYAQTLDFTCGPAALLMAFSALSGSFAASRTEELRLWREATTIFMTSGHGGCGPHGLALAAWRRGFGAEVYVNSSDTVLVDTVRREDKREVMRLVQADMEAEMATLGIPIHNRALGPDELEARAAAGAIPLVLISSYRIYRERFPHWVVVTGYDPHYLYMHDPYIDEGETVADCINMPVSRSEFQRMAHYGRSGLKAVVLIHPDREAVHG